MSGTHRLEGVGQGHHGEEVGDKLGTAVPVVELRVGHQGGPDGGAHELLQVETPFQGPGRGRPPSSDPRGDLGGQSAQEARPTALRWQVMADGLLGRWCPGLAPLSGVVAMAGRSPPHWWHWGDTSLSCIWAGKVEGVPSSNPQGSPRPREAK